MQVVALAQQKGGVMKSSLAVHLAAEALRGGAHAVVFEMDKQGTASFWAQRRGGAAPDVRRVDSMQLSRELRAASDAGAAYVFLDLPGAHNPAVSPAIRAADLVLIPARPAEVDIVASAETLGTVQRLGKRYVYVLTFVPAAGSRAAEAREALESEGHPVAPTPIGDRKVFSDAVVAGQTAAEREPGGKAAGEIASLWRYVQTQLESKHVEVA